MSSIDRHHRTALQYLPIRAAVCVAAIVLAGCASTQDAKTGGNSLARVDFASCAKPQYPREDLQAGHQGTVNLGFLVDENGQVMDSKVTTSSGFATLDEAVRTALVKCRFHPALDNGKPVQQWAHVQYVWTLS